MMPADNIRNIAHVDHGKTAFQDFYVTIPMPNSNIRSLNLAYGVSVVLYEALRQCEF